MKSVFYKKPCSSLLLFFYFRDATILSKSSYPVYVKTEPAGATIVITNKKGIEIFKGKSPAVINLKSGAGYFSKAAYQVKLTMNGYEEKIIPVNFKLNGWYFGNILLAAY